MRIKEIIGENYWGHWEKTRTACRGIIVQDGRILLSYETKTGQWMLPGGGLEDGEDEQACCIREVAEETGILIQPSECQLEIDEYYEGWKWVNRYFFGTVTGETEIRLTDREKEVGMEPRWLPVTEIIEIFSGHAAYADTDEMRRGMYLREYTALCELISDEKRQIWHNNAPLCLTDLQPSQFYISAKKLQDIRKWFDPSDLSSFEPIPVKMLNGIPVMTDGHTRAVAALQAKLDSVPLVWECDNLSWEMYRRCVSECRKRQICSPEGLLNCIIPEKEYRVKWDQWCDAMQAEINGLSVEEVPEKSRKNYMSLLLLADEQEEMVDRYLTRGTMYILRTKDDVRAECVVTDEGNGILEIKKLAVDPNWQGHGYGRMLIDEMEDRYSSQYNILQVGTGDSPLTIPFYERCGFVRHHTLKNFFSDHYDHPIFEAGKQLIDMIVLQKMI